MPSLRHSRRSGTSSRSLEGRRPSGQLAASSSFPCGRCSSVRSALLTDLKDYFTSNLWHVRIDPDSADSLMKESAVDDLLWRGVDRIRFIRKQGQVSATKTEKIVLAIAAIIEYP